MCNAGNTDIEVNATVAWRGTEDEKIAGLYMKGINMGAIPTAGIDNKRVGFAIPLRSMSDDQKPSKQPVVLEVS